MGLNSDLYGTAWSNILSLEPLPTLSKVYAFIAQEERQLALTKGMENCDSMEGEVFKATVSTNRNSWSSKLARTLGRPRCSYRHKLGHEKKQCYELGKLEEL